MQSLEIISLNFWDILISLANLVILYLILRKFLYKPVRKLLAERQATLDAKFQMAEEAQHRADVNRAFYEDRLTGAKEEAQQILDAAEKRARERSARTALEAKKSAEAVIQQARDEAELERKKAEQSMKREIADVSAELVQKLLETSLTDGDRRRMTQRFLDELEAE